jgi:RNA polymerase sigma-32 factor
VTAQSIKARTAAEERFVSSAMRAEMLSHEDESRLAGAWRSQGDEKSLHRLTNAYMRLVVAVARRHKGYGLPEADLIQEGAIGLMQAANRFEPERGFRFSTYAAWWIRASIQDYILRNWSIVRLGSTAAQKNLFFKLRSLRAALGDLNGGAPGPEATTEIATRLRVKESEVESMAVRLARADPSLNAPVSGPEDNTTALQDILVDDAPLPDLMAMTAHDDTIRRKVLTEALETLNPRQRMIVLRRRAAEDPVTLEALGSELGITKERVRQIENAALEKMRDHIMAALGAAELEGLMP